MFKRVLLAIAILLAAFVIIGTIGLMAWARAAKRPTNLGINNGKLAVCPDTPNCVSTQATRDSQKMPALAYTGSLAEAKARLIKVVQAIPRAELFTAI